MCVKIKKNVRNLSANDENKSEKMKSTRPYKVVLEFLSDYIEQHKDEVNCKLPSERMLAIKFNASRRSVRRAYDQLILKKTVVKIHGKGHFTTGYKKSASDVAPSSLKEIFLIIPALKSAFTHDILIGISDFCDEHELEVSLKFSRGKPTLQNHYINSAVKSGAKGIILFPIDNETFSDDLLKLSESRFPLTIIDRHSKNINASFVSTDNTNAMIDAVKFLHSKKINSMVYMTSPQSLATTVAERLNGFKEGFKKYYGKNPDDSILMLDNFTPKEIYRRLEEYLTTHPVPQVIITPGVQHITDSIFVVLNYMNLSVPKDIRFMLFDNDLSYHETQVLCPYVIMQQAYLIGYESAKFLYNQIYGDLRTFSKRFPITIVDYSKKTKNKPNLNILDNG